MPIKQKLPKTNELVIGTVTKIEDHGAFVTLDEYGGLEAYVPLNEVSHSWFKSIREVLKVDQKRVFKVIKIDPRRNFVDISLKRVSDSERRHKLQEWKRFQRSIKLLELACEKLGKRMEEALEEGAKIEAVYGEVYSGFEAAVTEGVSALEKAGIKEPWLTTFYNLAKSYVKLPRIKLSAVLTITCSQGDGVERIKEALSAWKGVQSKYPDIEAKFYVIGPPRYRIDAEAYDPKRVETFIDEIVKVIVNKANEKGCQATFQRIENK
ncbi:MAG: translation initiation factor IF-2 subunit alpha [Thermofilaceae archaeon]|nr:translation initiation factor IF-2 subunit alpha [Thermofilaceae archaeon]MCX8181061.1 translation initiation factor IF-2 subunit alpha [Thermofilaceae archaeon]MDW8004542.1 translation initiation factor IF-2 subunit alpha [Thermofilaceae archaeon]